jgi:type I restriction enzyme R subunit
VPNEADTCRKFVVPKLQGAGWDTDPHSIAEQRTFTDGRIFPLRDGRGKRGKQKRADYLLRYTSGFAIAVVEAKADYSSAADGLQQAKEYAQILGLKFAYSTNGAEIAEFDYLTGKENLITEFPAPEELWSRLKRSQEIDETAGARLAAPFNHTSGKPPRYYQEIAINRSVQSVLQGKKRILITMATGTGKTDVAFQICWKLWSSRWNRRGEPQRRPRLIAGEIGPFNPTGLRVMNCFPLFNRTKPSGQMAHAGKASLLTCAA